MALTTKQFFDRYYLSALVAYNFRPERALFALSQAAYESGLVSSNSIAARTNNLLGITGSPNNYGKHATGVVLAGSGLYFRNYPSAYKAFLDHKELLDRYYPTVAKAQKIDQFANLIVYHSPYVGWGVGEEKAKANYYNGLIKYYNEFAEYQRKYLIYLVIAIVAIIALFRFYAGASKIVLYALGLALLIYFLKTR
jgi:hypothetical protein